MYDKPLTPITHFFKRLGRHILIALSLIVSSLLIGMFGYHHFAHLSWLDAFLNAAMILSGMGPVDHLHSTGAKLFAGFYAIYSGILFIALIAIITAPIFHRFFHIFHLKDK